MTFLNKTSQTSWLNLSQWISFRLLLLITILVAFVPWFPEVHVSGIDASWMLGLNQAIAQGLRFGKDIMFTSGPYSAIYTQTYHPTTDRIMLWGSIYLAVSYFAALLWLMRGVKWYWVVMLTVVLSGTIYSRDALLFSMPLLLGILTFKVLASGTEKFKVWHIALLFAPLGLLPLIKISLFLICLLIIGLCTLFFIESKQHNLALVCVLTPLVSVIVFWVLAGQFLVDLPNYFLYLLPLVSGYSESMVDTGDLYEIIFYLVSMGAFLLVIGLQRQFSQTAKLFLWGLYGIFLFIVFKAGFVRHSHGHELISGGGLLFAACFLPFILKTRWIALPLCCALATWVYTVTHSGSNFNILNKITVNYAYAWLGFTNRFADPDWMQVGLEQSFKDVNQTSGLPKSLKGTTDVYSYGQLHLFASGNRWSPRLLLQSYAAYTPALAEANKAHLLGEHAPDNIIFRVEPIDKHFPSLEDGASWPVLLSQYQPNQEESYHKFLLLHKKNISENTASLLSSASRSAIHTLGETVNLPLSDYPLYAQIEIKPSIFGRLAALLFKLTPLQITVALMDGQVKQYRIISGMAEAGFILSPLVEDHRDFKLLYEDIMSNPMNKLVRSIQIAPEPDSIAGLWQNDYILTLRQLKTSTPSLLLLKKQP